MNDLAQAQAGDDLAFERLIAPYRRPLLVHAYRLLGSSTDAEDALQEALLAAWRGLASLRTPEALRSWLYRVTTNAALRLAERRGPRVLSWDHAPAADPLAGLSAPVGGPVWVEPFADVAGPEGAALRREETELAWIAALQHLPAAQRAVLVLKDVLAFSSAEIAEVLDTSTAAVNSALQRARATLATLSTTTPTSDAPVDRAAVKAFVDAFNAGDVAGVVRLLADDVRFTMPPLPAWFDGMAAVGQFLAERVFATPWRTWPVGPVNGHPAVLGEQLSGGSWRPGALMVLHLDHGRIRWLATFVEPGLVARWPGRNRSGTDR